MIRALQEVTSRVGYLAVSLLLVQGLSYTLCSARAQQVPQLQVTWEQVSTCGSAAAVHAAIVRWVGEQEPSSGEPTIRLRARVDREEIRQAVPQFVLDLELVVAGVTTHETYRARRCEALVELVALKVGLLIDPIGIVTEVTPDARGSEAEAGKAAPSSVASNRTLSAPQASSAGGARRSQWGARVEGGATVGLWPDPAPTIGGLALWRWRALQVELGARYVLEQELGYAMPEAVGARLRLWSVTLRSCAVPRLGIVALPICVGGEAGALSIEGYGVAETRRVSDPWFSASLGPGLRIPLTKHIAAALSFDGVAHLQRVAFHVRNLPRLYRSERNALRIAAGIEVIFP